MKTLHNKHCLDTVRLARYFGGTASDVEKTEIETHLADCDECLDLFVTAGRMLKEDGSDSYEEISEENASDAAGPQMIRAASPVEKQPAVFFRTVFEFISRIFLLNASGGKLSPAMCRSVSSVHGEAHVFMKDFDAFSANIIYERPDNGHGDITVSVMGKKPEIIRLSLESDEKGKDSRPFRGEVEIFEKISFGFYRLIFRTDNLEEKSISFKIDRTGIHEF